MTSDTVSTAKQAFSDLRQVLERCLGDVQHGLDQAVKRERYQQAQELAKSAHELAELRAALDSLAERLEQLLRSTSIATTTDSSRLPKGLKTPQGEYRVPVLQALVELGGQADINQVLERVRELMAGKLNAHDLATLSDGETPRWRNTAQWARNSMREDGLIRDDTPRGTWAISENGRRWVEKNPRSHE